MLAMQTDLFAPDIPTTTNEATTTDHPAVMYRCHACERSTHRPHVWRKTVTRTTTARAWTNLTTERPERFTEITWTDDAGRTTRGTHPPASHCASCSRPTSGKAIDGRYNPSRRCDDRCLYAKGPDCECSCGGRNHGRGYTC